MIDKKNKFLKIAIVAGGWSDEREISLMSGKNVYSCLRKNKFNVKFFDKSKINCNPNCTLLLNNILLYSDKDHWSFDGMNYFGQKLEEYEFFSLIK